MAKYLIDSNDITIEEVENTDNIKLNFANKIAVVTGTTPWVTISGSLKNFHMDIPFPEGFNFENCMVIGASCYNDPIPMTYYDDGGSWHASYDISLGEYIYIHGINNNIGDDNAVCKVILMKIS